jgi:hypothetical protein
MRRALLALGDVIGASFVIRAMIELATLDYGDSASYRDDWVGPSLVGVLARCTAFPGRAPAARHDLAMAPPPAPPRIGKSTASENEVR